MTTLELVPGLVTTREAIAAVYGCGTFQGIEPADGAGMVFVYSDPSAGAEYGYTFDGRAEDDEFGPLYLYTGAGAKGDQKPSGRNSSLLTHAEKGRELHLFVAHGKVRGSGAMRQRYVGQMVLDAVQPYEQRWAPGADGVLRRVLVFRLRPVPGATLDEANPIEPATQDTLIELPEPPKASQPPAKPVKVPQQTQAKDKQTEQHATAQTTANVTGGKREVIRREGQLVTAFEAHLKSLGHTVKSFQITVKGERGTLVPDLYDATDNALYEAKGKSRREDVRMAIGQLLDYRRHIGAPPGLRLVVLLPSHPSDDVRDLLTTEGIHLVVQTKAGFDGFPLPAASV
ncbi:MULTISPECIES: hypothetical protein [Streptomyces]|uniref:ScoMcrA-like SRA domain-containing protein n=1 Tax=Streptomyces rimosus subsp. rimosus TaxID=132474 RepID=A0ABY3Z725_STRRM|nr:MULTISPECIES: hypothetical protein [Streptomyces]KOT45692.1 hypothetical protein ADK42_02760 [Streptomyces rimosus subsp. rimosus]KOT46968.1 hypothetical protein ADK84_02325 [Streptomyces sp. NRRL WC-3701]KOT67129.1 hypothetical protein ADK44_04590 [Streptomyces rimosus subsp. rimosus]KOT70793.1 hypothetical protein ADK45_04560 [Streptomyces rimosus subsp. rimosus]KOT85247.1 hypothetical protein ADK47_02745 [Streptomyces rimosus subsp. rimosus]